MPSAAELNDRPTAPTPRSFADLVREAAEASVEGWDFSWLTGRATEERPAWGYQRLLAARLARPDLTAVLDIDTGGGEVLAGALDLAHCATNSPISAATSPTHTSASASIPTRLPGLPRFIAATEAWPPNAAKATALLAPRGVVVVRTPLGSSALPFADAAFDFATARHPVAADWTEIARVLRPGGAYLSQEVGPESVRRLSEYFLGPLPDEDWLTRHPDRAAAHAEAAGLAVDTLKSQRLRMEFHDIGAVIYFLRKVVWIVPDFTVDHYLPRLQELHDEITTRGPFITHSTRFLIEAHKPR